MKNLIKAFLIFIYLPLAFGGISSLNLPKKEVRPKESKTEWDKEKNKKRIEKNEEIIKKEKEKEKEKLKEKEEQKSSNEKPTYLPGNVVVNLQEYINRYVCPQGRVPEITFSAAQFYQGSGNTTQIQGQLQPTAIGGSPSNTYVGVNLGTKDLIYITKMTVGKKVVGYNILLSLCRLILQPQSISGGGNVSIPIIDVTRMPTVAGASPFIVTDSTNCPMGSVDNGTVVLNIPPYQVPGTSAIVPATQIQKSFTRANCL